MLPAFTAMTGTATVTFTPKANGCTGTPVVVTYTVNARPNAGSISGGTSVCQGGTLTLSSNGLSGGTWSSNNGNATIDANTGQLSGVSAGMSTITYSVTANSCTSSTSVVVTVDAPATTASAGTDQSICSDAFAVLAANTPSVGTGAWTVSTGPSTSSSQFSNTGSPTAIFTPAGGVGTYTLTWTITNGTCVSSDELDIDALSCLCAGSDAAASAYNDGWQTGDSDNPSAFGAWTLSNTGGSNAGHFTASSTGNNGSTPLS